MILGCWSRQTRSWRARSKVLRHSLPTGRNVEFWPIMAKQKQDDQLEHTCSSYVRIRDVALKTCQRQWTIWKSSERGSGISVLAARHDDEDISKILNWICLWASSLSSSSFSWLSFAIRFYRLSYILSLLDGTHCPHRLDESKFSLVAHH